MKLMKYTVFFDLKNSVDEKKVEEYIRTAVKDVKQNLGRKVCGSVVEIEKIDEEGEQ